MLRNQPFDMRSFVVNKIFSILPVLALGLSATVHGQTPAPAPAPAPVPTKIAVMNIQAALAATKDGQTALDELDKKLIQPRRKDIEAKQADLKELQEKLQRGGNTLSQSAKDDMQRQIDQKNTRLNRDMQDAQAELEEEQQKIVTDLLGKMNPIVEKYLNENGFAILFDVSDPQRSGVFWAATAIDITGAVVDLYNKAAPASAPAKPASSAVKPPATAVKPVVAPPKTPTAKP
jgi:outer membrane protein